jgi:hypothetical protein
MSGYDPLPGINRAAAKWPVSANKPTYAVQQIAALLDHLVGERAQRGRNFEA